MTLAVERDLFREYQYATNETRSDLENEIVQEHQNLAYYVANQYFSSLMESEDIEQVALIALLRAIRTFDPSKGMQFSTYAVKVIHSRVVNALRVFKSNKHKAHFGSVALDKPRTDDGETLMMLLPDDFTNTERTAIDRVLLRSIQEAADGGVLSEGQRWVLMRRNSDPQPTLQALADERGTTYANIRQLEQRAYQKLRKHMGVTR